MDVGTVQWWMKQSDDARAAITLEKGEHINHVLLSFIDWVMQSTNGGHSQVQVWGNSSTFDVVLMEEAFRKCEMDIPWKFWGHRCYRTLKNLFPGVTKPEFTGIKHHALDDAKFQALHLINILNHINCLQNVFDSATNPPQTNEQENSTIQSPGFIQDYFAAAGKNQTVCPGACTCCGSKEPGCTCPPQDPAASVPGTP